MLLNIAFASQGLQCACPLYIFGPAMENYIHNHMEIMRSIQAECAILMPRLEALDVNAADYIDQEMAFLDDFIEVGVNPLTTIINFIKAHHPDHEEKHAEMVNAGLAVGEIFRVMNEKRAVHNLLIGQ